MLLKKRAKKQYRAAHKLVLVVGKCKKITNMNVIPTHESQASRPFKAISPQTFNVYELTDTR